MDAAAARLSREKPEVSPTLIDNWVEERQCAHLDKDNRKTDGTFKKELLRDGHKGLMSSESGCSYQTTIQMSYQLPSLTKKDCTGQRQKLIQKNLHEIVNAHLRSELASKEPDTVNTSTTHHDYSKNTGVDENIRKLEHDLSESPVSYWDQNAVKITGVTPYANAQKPFNKNASFSCPIEQQLDNLANQQ